MATRVYTDLTLKRLYGLSGNRCAFQGCEFDLIYEEGNLSDICHIEALNPGGPRYNPSSTDKERNDYPNLILLCKNHHYIVDQQDATGSPYYPPQQLKAMKQALEGSFSAFKTTSINNKMPSLLAKIILSLSKHRTLQRPVKRPAPFKIEEKISFNQVIRNYGIIQKYAAYFSIVETLYDELEAGQKATVLESINDCYITCCRPNQSADDTLDLVQDTLINRVSSGSGFQYSEELEWCVKLVVVDGFLRCKILEEPVQ